MNHILAAVTHYHLGYSLTQTQALLQNRLHIHVPERTIFLWLNAYRPFTSYGRLRNIAKRTFAPERVIRSCTLHHRQPFRFQIHQAKLHLTLTGAGYPIPAQLARYLDTITSDYPHHLFTTSKHRASKLQASLSPRVTKKEDYSTRLAKLVLPTSPSNKKRHETLQRFMLVNDASTIAVEVPVYLTQEDISYFRNSRLTLNLPASVITGHIDFLQIRNGSAYILDYKPDARGQYRAPGQLIIYALALSRRTGIPL